MSSSEFDMQTTIGTIVPNVFTTMAGFAANPQKDATLQDKKLRDAEIDQLVAFLESLSGNVAFVLPTVPK